MTKKKKRFGIDIDGTVTDPGTFIPYLNEHFSKNLTIQDITEYELSHVLGITKKEFWSWMQINESTIYEQARLANNVKDILTAWKKDHELFYISARPQKVETLTINWFHLNDIPYDHIELLGKHDKLSSTKNHLIDIFFEDKHDNACQIAEECKIPVILLDTPYNQDPVPPLVYRAQHWTEAKNIVTKLF